jgi:hypothetical protein
MFQTRSWYHFGRWFCQSVATESSLYSNYRKYSNLLTIIKAGSAANRTPQIFLVKNINMGIKTMRILSFFVFVHFCVVFAFNFF